MLWDVDTAGLLATQADIDASGVKHPVSIATVDMSNRDAIYKAAEELKVHMNRPLSWQRRAL